LQTLEAQAAQVLEEVAADSAVGTELPLLQVAVAAEEA